MMKLSFKNRILLWLMPALVVGLLALSSSAYWYIDNLIREELTKSMLATTSKTAESINVWLKTLILEPETIASTPAAKAINKDFSLIDTQNINRHILLHEKYPDIFQDVYAANENGEYHTVKRRGNEFYFFVGTIRTRDYFTSIMSGGPAQITPPLVSRTTGIPTIFVVAPIRDGDRKPQGLIGVGLSLGYVQKVAESLKSGTSGYGFVIASDGTFISHPDKSLIMRKKIFQYDDDGGNELGKRMLSGGSGVFRYVNKGGKKVVFYQPIPTTGWSVASVISESELFAPAVSMVKTLAIITLVTLLVLAAAILVVASRLTRPLQNFTHHAEEIAAGNLLVETLEVPSQDEIGTLAHAFNVMTVKLQQTMDGLHKSEEKYRSIFEQAVEGIFQSTFDGRFVGANPAMARILGYDSPDDLVSSLSDIGNQLYVNPEDRDEILGILHQKNCIAGREVQFYRRDNQKIWIALSARLVRDASGAPLLLEGVISDISSRKIAEEEKQALTVQLNQMQRMESIGRLAGGIAHDFNNLLTPILAYADLLKSRMAPDSNEFKRADNIMQAADKARILTQQLLGFGRKQILDMRTLDMNVVILSFYDILRRTIRENVDIQLHLTPHMYGICADGNQLQQIIMNLAINAQDAISGNGVISIETAPVTLDDEYVRHHSEVKPGKYLMLAVTDTGCGMSPETCSKVFEPFFTTKETGKGTGLGLATVYGLLKQHGGSIWVYSELGRGTAFKLYFPIVDDPIAEVAEESAEPLELDAGGRTVLLVEDDEMVRTLVSDLLQKLGFDAIVAVGPKQALALAKGQAIDLLITDVVMPDMDGAKLYQHLLKSFPGLKVLYMSGYTNNVIVHHGVLDKGINFIQKPFAADVFTQKIGSILKPER